MTWQDTYGGMETQHIWLPDPRTPSDDWEHDEESTQMSMPASVPVSVPVAMPRQVQVPSPSRPVSRRRPRPGAHIFSGNPRSFTVAFLVFTITVCAATMLSWSISYSYNQLHGIALLVVSERFAQWWPLTVYGPWLVAGLSILRASVQHRTARRSWAVMLLSSGTAVALCIGQTPGSVLAMVVVGIPPITALVCFRELVGQFSSRSGPRHAADTVGGPKQP
ncbi:DUF2637 domain-containing protein [Streptomyces sp. MA5143a]|uniref:DUF2637 domain-containing protein n=1 Tax=Streptomyces sp. MA5143a TaxID=2083010 RepID=UPI0021593823|nr:DUF2637 domain-containing protein [Streptomyces sp. MA5143a]